MIYDLSIPIDKENSLIRLKQLIEKGSKIELTEKIKRTLNQNSYLHLILSWFAWEYGDTLDYVKLEIFKKQVNPEIFKTEFINKKTGEIREAWRSSKNISTGEMTTAINRFRDYSSKEAGIYLPEPSDLVSIQIIERELSQNNAKQYI